jgi:hypothetical protein
MTWITRLRCPIGCGYGCDRYGCGVNAYVIINVWIELSFLVCHVGVGVGVWVNDFWFDAFGWWWYCYGLVCLIMSGGCAHWSLHRVADERMNGWVDGNVWMKNKSRIHMFITISYSHAHVMLCYVTFCHVMSHVMSSSAHPLSYPILCSPLISSPLLSSHLISSHLTSSHVTYQCSCCQTLAAQVLVSMA